MVMGDLFLAWQGTWNPGVTFGIAARQTTLILALTGIATIALLVFAVITVNFLVDLAYAAVDPRLRNRT